MGNYVSFLIHHLKLLYKWNEVDEARSKIHNSPEWDKQPFDGAFVRSGLSGKNLTFHWEIENFDVLLSATLDSKLIETQKLQLSTKLLRKGIEDEISDNESEDEISDNESEDEDNETVLTKWIVGFTNGDKDWVGIHLKLDQGGEKPNVYGSLQIRIPNLDGSGFFLKMSSSTVLLSGATRESCGWSKFLNRKEVKRLPLRESGTLVIEGKIKAVTMFETVESEKLTCKTMQRAATKKLGEDLEGFCGQHEDPFPIGGVKIVSSEGTEHYSNKVILSARSPVFAAMFKSGMQEETNNVLILEDCCATSVSAMLRYVHTGKLLEMASENWDIDEFGKVAHIADKYDLTELHKFCDDFTAAEINYPFGLEWGLQALEMAKKFRLTKTVAAISSKLSGSNNMKCKIVE